MRLIITIYVSAPDQGFRGERSLPKGSLLEPFDPSGPVLGLRAFE